MADHLFLSLKPPPYSLIFPCFHRRPWRRSSFSGEIRFPVRELIPLANSTSPSRSPSSSSPMSLDASQAKFDIVSTIKLHDGSHVFRFGDAREIERDAKTEVTMSSVEVKEEMTKITEEVSRVSAEKGVKEEDSLGRSEPEDPNDKSNSEKKRLNSNVKTVKEKRAAPTNRSEVIKIKDRKRSRSPSKKKKEALSQVSVTQHDDKVATQNSGLSQLNSEVSRIAAVPKISGEEKVSVSGESETTSGNEMGAKLSSLEPLSESHLQDKVAERAVESGVIASSSSLDCFETQDYPQISKNDIESEPRLEFTTSEVFYENHDLQEVSQEKARIKVFHVSTIGGGGGNLDAVESSITDFDPTVNHLVEPKAIAVVSPHELISTTGATHDDVDETCEKSVTDQSDVAMRSDNVEILASTMKEEITLDEKKGNDVEVFAPSMTETGSIETASGREEIAQKEFYLDSGFASLRNPSKALAGREDANFISSQRWLGVADGVCQWSFEGINAGVFAQELMRNCQKIISVGTSQINDPVDVLSRSLSETKSHGSSTALVVHFDNHVLHIVNIGDSGFMVFRNGTVLQKSSPMFHEFGFPLQITQGDDPSKLAEVYHVNLEEGDIIITATDGLFDNLYEKEITCIVSSSLQQNLETQKIAELLASKAQEVGCSASTRTPFADAAQAAGYKGYKGGKPDAVTVIVSQVRTL